MKIRITKGGIFGKDGEIAVGTEIDVKEEPKGWVGRYDVISKGDKEGKTAVVNPTKSTKKPDSGDDEQPKTPAEVLAMGANSEVQFMTFKSAATKLLGDKTPSTKADILTALEELATQP